MGTNKSKINKSALRELVNRTNRPQHEIKAMHGIFLKHFPSGNIESPEDLLRCLRKFTIIHENSVDKATAGRLYRIFNSDTPNQPIDFVRFVFISHVLEHGPAKDRVFLFFRSFDVNNDALITRDDLEKCLPSTIESQHLISQLMKDWDMNNDGVVSFEDFQQYVTSNPSLLSVFASVRERVQIENVNNSPVAPRDPSSRFITSP